MLDQTHGPYSLASCIMQNMEEGMNEEEQHRDLQTN